MEKMIINPKVCQSEHRDLDVMLYLCSLLSGVPITVDTFEKARKEGLLKFSELYDRRFPFPSTVSLSQSGQFILESFLAKCAVSRAGATQKKDEDKDRYDYLAEKMIEVYPKGVQIGENGVKRPWKGNPVTIADRLRKFVTKFKKYEAYSDDDFVTATKNYLRDKLGSSDMRLLMYFISKDDKVKGVLRSDLADYLERLHDESSDSVIPAADWDVKLF